MPRRFSHWKPRYLVDRLALLWYERRHPEAPWLTHQAIEILDDWLRPGDRGLEWGSGRSTTWLAQRVQSLTSVEHDSVWFDRVNKSLRRSGVSNVDYRLVRVGDGDSRSVGHPYVAVVEALPPASLDFVLVDGVMREHCAVAALDRLKVGGLLVLDNANWFLPHSTRSPSSVGRGGQPPSTAWTHVAEKLRSSRIVWTSNGVTDTALFVKA